MNISTDITIPMPYHNNLTKMGQMIYFIRLNAYEINLEFQVPTDRVVMCKGCGNGARLVRLVQHKKDCIVDYCYRTEIKNS